MKNLKRLGEWIGKALFGARTVSPLLPSSIGDKAIDFLTKFSHAIGVTEALGQQLSLKGPDKLKGAAPLIADEVLAWADTVGYEVDDKDAFKAAATALTSAWADVLNSLKKK